jgi:3-hydroxybutyrate dehydrogenase
VVNGDERPLPRNFAGSLTERVAVVTGGASGIGKAIAERLAAEGATVAVVDRDAERAAETARSIRGLSIVADLTNADETKGVIDIVAARLGPPTILINDAGFQHIASLPDFPEDHWRAMLELMLTAPFLLIRAAWPYMIAAGWGRIVNVASIHAVVASPYKVAYVSAKHGLLGLTRTAALEGGLHGITANALCPAYVRTPLVEAQIRNQAEAQGLSEGDVVNRIMLDPAAIKRLIEPEEVAEMVAYLCSDSAALISGAAMMIDAGWTAR